jgi:uncharacterized cupin superfamily protein
MFVSRRHSSRGRTLAHGEELFFSEPAHGSGPHKRFQRLCQPEAVTEMCSAHRRESRAVTATSCVAGTRVGAPLEESGSGLVPVGDGPPGSDCRFESREFGFQQLGIKLRVLEPGQPNGLYHSENQQEAFPCAVRECRLLVAGEERLLRPWDFFHSPPGTEHIFVGAGDGPCVILMAGARLEDERLHYPVSELAARYGASVEEETTDFAHVYPRFEPSRRERPSYWDQLPWA